MNQDPEIDRLVSAFVDGTLNEEDRVSFERQVRENPEALSRVAEAVRFEVELADAVNPDHLELVQQRRTVIDRSTGKPVLVESTQRISSLGSPEAPKPIAPRHSRWWLVSLSAAAVIGAGGWWWASKNPHRQATVQAPTAPRWMDLALKNPGFELPDLGVNPMTSYELKDWQEKFITHNATVMNGFPGGAHSGRQVARLAPGGHIKQTLIDPTGAPMVFQPGIRLRVSGWVAPTERMVARSDGLIVALHFVDDQLRQYVVVYRVVGIDGSGWRHFSVEMEVPEQESFEPSYLYTGTNPSVSVRGRPILLSITNTTWNIPAKATFALDDLKVEVMHEQEGGGEVR